MAAPELNVRANATLDDLYRRHVGDVYRYTYAVLGNHADAEDVTQTTFVNALRALERGDQPRDPSNWLLAISHNIVRQRWRQAAVRPTEVELVTDVPDESTEPNVELDELVRALQRIPPAQREALVMRELEGRSYNEISELLGLTISALETLLFRARRSLAEELENIVTCQSAELAMSKQLDGRLSRKERRRLDEHLADCDACAKLVETQRRQRRAFKGLAVLPVPVGLALFKGVPTASAATLPTIGIGATGSGTGVGATGVGAGGAGAGAGGATAAAGGTVAGGSILGGAVAKVAAVVIAGTVATGVGYEGVKAVTNDAKPTPARSSDERAATPSSRAATPATVPATNRSGRGDTGTSFVPSGGSSGSSSSSGSSIAANPAKQPLDDSPVVPTGSGGDDADNAAAHPDATPRKNPKAQPPATTPPVAAPTPPETPAGPPASTPPESPGASGSTSPATSPETPPAGSGGSGGQSACPAGGSGPGNGSGCGLARGHEREAAPVAPSTPAPSTATPSTPAPTPATTPTEPAVAPESAAPSFGEPKTDMSDK
jgi:RNA polymerase sigma factor (sigma-70 family)